MTIFRVSQDLILIPVRYHQADQESTNNRSDEKADRNSSP